MKRIAKIFIAVVMSSFVGGTVHAQDMPFMNYNHTVQALATGGASGTNGAYGAFYEGKAAFGLGYIPTIGSGSSDAIFRLGGFGKAGKFSIGAGGMLSLMAPYEMYSPVGAPTGSFSPMKWNASINASYGISSSFSVGVAARMMSSTLAAGSTINAFTADVSALYRKELFSVGLSVGNIGKASSPTYAGVDAAFFKSGFEARANASYYFAGSFSGGLGLQYGIKDIVFVRGGYHLGTGNAVLASFASAGLGVKFACVNLDVTYLYLTSAAQSALAIGLSCSF